MEYGSWDIWAYIYVDKKNVCVGGDYHKVDVGINDIFEMRVMTMFK